nr:signal peptide peptidase SppA [Halovulum dunhuangense]
MRDAHPVGPHIARVEIWDVIYSDPWRDEMLVEIAEDDDARALILNIDSPGGTVVGSEALYLAIRQVAEAKPVVVTMDGAAASGAYMAAIAGDHLIARGNTITGSIGVIFEYVNFAELMDRVGVGVETIRSSDLKADASPLRELSPEGRAAEQALVDETQAWFRGLVAEARGLEGAALDAVTDGRTFTGRMAVENGLIDAIGGEAEALDWLESVEEGLSELPVETWALPEEEETLLPRFLGAVLGLDTRLPDLSMPNGPRLMAILK